MGLVEPAPPVFITDPPPNGPTLRVGDWVSLKPDAMWVIRAGYRKRAADYLPEADRALAGLRYSSSWQAVIETLGVKPAHRDLRWAVARAMAQRDGLGGPDRGLLVEPVREDHRALLFQVVDKRMTRIGRYYPPSGSHDDYEDGGLSGARTVVLLDVSCLSLPVRGRVAAGHCTKNDLV